MPQTKTESKRKFTFPEALWAGTEQSLILAMEAHDTMMAGFFDQEQVAPAQPEAPYNFRLQGNVGVVTIRGPLVNDSSPYNRYYGVSSYNDIRAALVHAATNTAVKAILLDIDSGGGAVSGVSDAGNLITTIDKSVKPVYSFTGGTMASAAVWLGASGRGIWVAETALSGSVGVIATHMERSKMLKEMGIAVTVFRSGEFKALVNSVEPLTEEARKGMQLQLDAAYKVFAEHMSTQLGMSMPVFESTVGQGREFFGAQAVEVGLAKGVKNYDSMISMIESKLIDKSAKKADTSNSFQRGTNMSRQALTEQQIAALAAGAGALAAGETVVETVAEVVEPLAETPPVVEPKAETPPAVNDGVLAYLKGEITSKDAQLLAQSLELAALKSKVTNLESNHVALMKIAATSLTNMKVGLNQAKADYSAVTPEALLADHAATAVQFAAAFKVGGVSAAVLPEAKTETAAVPNMLRAARIAATRFPKK